MSDLLGAIPLQRMLRDLYDLVDILDRQLIALRRARNTDTVAHLEDLRNRMADRIQRLEIETVGRVVT